MSHASSPQLRPVVWAAMFIALIGVAAAYGQHGVNTGTTLQPALVTGSLANSYNTTVHGDYVAAGVGLRGSGTGSITVSGIPAGATVVQAFLYWVTIGTNDTFTSPTLEGSAVGGSLIGTGGDTCWGASGNFFYRADVTSIVTGNGGYTIAGLPSSSPTTDDSQGAAIVAIYFDPAATVNHTIVIDDGGVTTDGSDPMTDTLSGFVPDSPLTNAAMTILMGDGQSTSSTVDLNAANVATNPFTGADGDLWDTPRFDVTTSNPPDPSTVTVNPNGDCLAWAATVFSVSTDTPAVPALPRTLLLAALIALLTAGGLLLRR